MPVGEETEETRRVSAHRRSVLLLPSPFPLFQLKSHYRGEIRRGQTNSVRTKHLYNDRISVSTYRPDSWVAQLDSHFWTTYPNHPNPVRTTVDSAMSILFTSAELATLYTRQPLQTNLRRILPSIQVPFVVTPSIKTFPSWSPQEMTKS